LAEQTDHEMEAQLKETLSSLRQVDKETGEAKENRTPMVGALLNSQSAWLKYRNAQCEMISSQWSGGTGMGEIASTCLIELNRQRIEELEKLSTLELIPPWP